MRVDVDLMYLGTEFSKYSKPSSERYLPDFVDNLDCAILQLLHCEVTIYLNMLSFLMEHKILGNA